jgi:hypothetical protein
MDQAPWNNTPNTAGRNRSTAPGRCVRGSQQEHAGWLRLCAAMGGWLLVLLPLLLLVANAAACANNLSGCSPSDETCQSRPSTRRGGIALALRDLGATGSILVCQPLPP